MFHKTLLALAGTAACGVLPAPAAAGALDVLRQDYGLLFEQGTVIESDTAFIAPSIKGNIAAPGFGDTGDVAPNFWIGGLGVKTDLTSDLSLAVIGDQPYYADLEFTDFPIGPVTTVYKTLEFTALLRYKFDDRWSVFGGPRLGTFEADVNTFGIKYNLDRSTAWGYTAGVAYEIADTGTLARLAYKSPLKFNSAGSGLAVTPGGGFYPVIGDIDVQLPQSVILDVRVPILPTTFFLGSITWNEWSAMKLRPAQNSGNSGFSATNYDNNWVFEAGLAQFLTEHWIVSGSVTYDTGSHEEPGLDTVFSHLTTYAAGLTYLDDKFQITGTVGYTAVGSTSGAAENLGFAQANYSGNNAWSSRLNVIVKF